MTTLLPCQSDRSNKRARRTEMKDMKYMVIIQDSNVIGMCFGEIKFAVYDGDMSIGIIDHQGRLREIHTGQLINGRFEKQEDAQS